MIRELQKGDRLTADYLRELVREVRRGRVAAGHGLRQTVTPNGSVISLAATQRPAASGGSDAAPMQWRIALAAASGGDPLLRVHRGIAHWGGQHWVVWPVGGHDVADAYQDFSLADLADGAVMLVLWHTSEPPCPLYHCPLQPAGPEIDFQLSGADCACTLSGYPKPGSPEDYSPGPGAVSLHAPASIEADAADWTDCVALGAIAREGDQYTITQLHDATITVRAIVRGDMANPPEPPTDPDTPPCGHPGNEPGAGGDSGVGDDTEHPGDEPGAGGDSGGDDTDHPGDSPSPPSSGECE